MDRKDFSLYNYRRAIPTIIEYQVISKTVLALSLLFYKWVTGFFLWNMGRPAFTSGDLPYLLRTWQGWVLVIAGFIALVIYTIFDINAMILISSRIIHNEKVKALPIIKDAAWKSRHFRSLRGALIILYAALIAPLTGVSLGISLTSSFVIPDFIMSVIQTTFIFKVMYDAAMVVLTFLGFIHIFTFHFILIGDMSAKKAMKESAKIMKKNWLDFIKRYLVFAIKAVVILLGILLTVYVIPSGILRMVGPDQEVLHAVIVFITLTTGLVLVIYGLLFHYFLMMKLTLIYERYTGCDITHYTKADKRGYKRVLAGGIACMLLISVFSIGIGSEFDEFFPKTSNVQVIAHRAGGDLANENTVVGLEAAISHQADFSEIDVQRTSDGFYVINHDDTFERCCGEPRAPYEMTLEEIKQLGVVYSQNPLEPEAEVPTMEEYLDAAKGRMQVLIELKGKTADTKMVDDVYRMVQERDMTDEVMFIALNYDLLEYTEDNYPEIRTGYLCYFGFGKIQDMNVDVLLLEAETATVNNIEKIHAAGKKVGVWTVNDMTTMMLFMSSAADYIITDKVDETTSVREIISALPDEARVISWLVQR